MYKRQASDCGKGRRCFQEEFGKAFQSRTIRNWCKKFKETLSVLPKLKKNLHHPNEIEEENKMEVVTALENDACSSQREASRLFGIPQSSVCKILTEKRVKAYRYIMLLNSNVTIINYCLIYLRF